MAGGSLAVGVAATGGVDTGWTFYTPYSSMYASGNVILAAMAAFCRGILVDSDRI